MLVLQTDLVTHYRAHLLTCEDQDIRLTFHDEAAPVANFLLNNPWSHKSVFELSQATGFDVKIVDDVISELENDSMVLRLDYPDVVYSDIAISNVKKAGLFFNKNIMKQHFPQRLYGGEAREVEVLGWGIEFYHFVRAAREYMARGASRVNGSTNELAELWDHFAEEAFHDGMFLDGLVKCGLDPNEIKRRPPLATTVALLNQLWEASGEGVLDYAAVFAVMQPGLKRPTLNDVKERYNFLRQSYPIAAPLFDAFEKHDLVDIELEHSNLTIEPLLKQRKLITRYEMIRIVDIVAKTSDAFKMFFAGIQHYYRSSIDLKYRQLPNASAILHNNTLM